MERLVIAPRKGWKDTVANEGMLWAVTENGPYWNEAMDKPVYYKLTHEEQYQLEQAADDVHTKCITSLVWLLEEASNEDRNYWFDVFGIPTQYRDMVIKSWDRDEWSVYGRFDFILTDEGPKLLEYNADTPTTLIETAISQYNWMVENQKSENLPDHLDQFNCLHESLVNHWKDMKAGNNLPNKVHFAAFSQMDDLSTATYMAETAAEAGLQVQVLPIEQVGYNQETNKFVDIRSENIDAIFKLYPWEWMVEDSFGKYLPNSTTRWIEPSWKMLLSNKAILALLWRRHPSCEYLVPAYVNESQFEPKEGEKWVTKPLLSREGCNVTIWECRKNGQMDIISHSEGNYDENNVIYQKYIEWNTVNGKYPMLGVWMVGDDPVALGIREDDGPVTQNNSRFIPHVFGE